MSPFPPPVSSSSSSVLVGYTNGMPDMFRTPEIDLSKAKDLGEAFASPGLIMKRPL